ncbi:MAG: hypothetical protein U5K81_11560 [Trueperaceae bacterium]|nr:hypothetical protein [Trueperaceae bacterium]
MHTARPLRHALLANATFSLVMASLLVIAPSRVGDALALDAPGLLRFLGYGLVVFGADLVHQATRERVATWRALYASALDVLWVVGTAGLLLARPELLSLRGAVVALAVAGMVAVFAAWQLWAIDRAHAGSSSGLRRHCVAVHADVSADAMWRVLGDFGRIQRFTASLASSEILGDEDADVGAGAPMRGRARQCLGGGLRGLRARQQPHDALLGRGAGRSLPCAVHDARLESRSGRLTNARRGVVGTAPRPRYAAPVLMPLFAWRADRAIPEVVRRMTQAARGARGVEASRRGVRRLARPLPRAC